MSNLHGGNRRARLSSCPRVRQTEERVWGFVSKAGDAHAVYYALLSVEERNLVQQQLVTYGSAARERTTYVKSPL